MSSIKIAHFVPIRYQTWPPQTFLVSDWSISKKSSPLKLLSHMNWNLVGSIYMYGRFCIKFPQIRMKGERHRFSPLSLQFTFTETVYTACQVYHKSRGSLHLVKTGRPDLSKVDTSANWGKIWGTSEKLACILKFLSLLPDVPLPFTKQMCCTTILKKRCNQ